MEIWAYYTSNLGGLFLWYLEVDLSPVGTTVIYVSLCIELTVLCNNNTLG